jgi:lipopolysaccharide assembly outer membrane protein LptD (OstA)
LKKHTVLVIFVAFFLLLVGQSLDAQEPTITPEENTPEKKEVLLESADKITYDSKGETFVAIGQVIAIQGKNRIQCQELNFNLKDNTGVFEGNVTVTRDQTEIIATSMEGDFDEELYQFSGDVILKKEREEETGTSTIIWKAPTLTYNGETEEARSENGSDIVWKETTIKTDRAVYFPKDDEKNQLERIEMEGEILITEKERELQVGKAVYYLDSETLEAEKIIKAKFILGD